MLITLPSPLRNTLLALLGLYLALQTARAEIDPAAEGRRLIELESNRRLWLTPAEVAELTRENHDRGRCGGFMDVTDYPELPELFVQPLVPEDYRIRHRETVERLLPELSADSLRGFVQRLSSFPTRLYSSENGVKAAQFIRDTYVSFAGSRTDVKAELFTHSRWRQPSVIVRIEGQGPRKNETIILGAHLDSISQMFGFPNPNGAAPGADDDASGIATLLETFRVLSASGFRPDRTIEFMGYAAEEVGLWGSQEISRAYRTNNRTVAGVLQLDMTMFPGLNTGITFIMDHTNPELTEFGKNLVDTYVRTPWHETECGYGCSDHASWDKLGFPTVYPFEASFNDYNKKIHTDRDLLDFLDVAHGLHFAKFALSWAIEMAGDASAL